MGYVNWITTLSIQGQLENNPVQNLQHFMKPGRNPIENRIGELDILDLVQLIVSKRIEKMSQIGDLPTIHLMVVPSPKLTDKAPENV